MKTTMKRIALIIMSLIMTIVMGVSMNATHIIPIINGIIA